MLPMNAVLLVRVRIVERAAELARDRGLLIDGLRPAQARVLPVGLAGDAHRRVVPGFGDAPRAVVLHADAPRGLAELRGREADVHVLRDT